MSAASSLSSRENDPEGHRDDRADPLALLRRIGEQLDQHKKLRVLRGGTVQPSTGRPSPNELGEESSHEGPRDTSGAERSATGQGQRPAEGSTAGSRPGPSAASILRESGVSPEIIADVEDATGAQDVYPQLRVRLAPRGIIWLEGEITPVGDLDFTARVRVAYPIDHGLPVRTWAWWRDGPWIGPRHTNFGDGSVCAYELKDRTWSRDLPLVNYLDLVSGWLARHVYLRVLGRWPGRQALHTARERLTEHRPDEICGGCESGRTYEFCHRPRDVKRIAAEVEAEYKNKYGGQIQIPPENEVGFERWALTPWVTA